MFAVFASALLPNFGMNAVFSARKPRMPAKPRVFHVWARFTWTHVAWRRVVAATAARPAAAYAAANCIACDSRR
jgi:hypothetical protein